jgi:hypothetical protein
MVTVAPPAGPARRHSTTPSTPARRLSPALSAPNAQPPRVRFRRPRRPTPPRHLSTRPRRRNHRGRFAGARRARLHYRTTSRHATNSRTAPSAQPPRRLAVVPGTGPIPLARARSQLPPAARHTPGTPTIAAASPALGAHAYTTAPPPDMRPYLQPLRPRRPNRRSRFADVLGTRTLTLPRPGYARLSTTRRWIWYPKCR